VDNQTAESDAGDLLPQTVESIPTRDNRSKAEIREARLSCVMNYQAKSLEKTDALEANLGSLNSGLIRIGVSLDETIQQALESSPRTLESVQRLLPAIETHLRLTRQVDRFAQIEVRAAESRKPKPGDDDAMKRRLESSSACADNETEETTI
jgi:hypothetical protein